MATAPRPSSRPRRRRVPALFLLGALVAGLAGTMASPGPTRAADLIPLEPSQFNPSLTREVYGYLPYWTLDGGTDAYLEYDLLTTISFFSVAYSSNGAIQRTAPGYLDYVSPTATTIIEHAHAAGVRTDLTITFSSDPDTNTAFLNNAAAMARAISETVDLLASRGGDGVNIDLERLYNKDIPAYSAFVGAMRAAVVARNPYGQVSVATNGNTSGALMARGAVDAGADRAFLMGYSYRSGGTSPVGSVAPLTSFNGTLDLTRSLGFYADAGVPAEKIILGLPYYGRTWATTSSSLHASRNTAVGTCSFSPSTPTAAQIPSVAGGATIKYDSVEQSAWFARFDSANGTWCQTYYDDPRSLAAKHDLALARDLAGVGIWALGYDEGRSDYWAGLAAKLRPPGARYFPIAPVRVLDSRSGVGASRFQMGVPQAFQVAGLAGVPAGAVAVTGNLTTTSATQSGYVSLTPSKVVKPATSTLNVPAGDIRANGVTAALGTDGRLWAVYRAASTSATIQLLFDVSGYFSIDEAGGTAFHPIEPGRVLDSRSGAGAERFVSGRPQHIQVSGLAGVPAGATAVTGNLTAVNPTRDGYVALTPAENPKPSTSTLNLPARDVRANGVTVPLDGAGGLWAVFRSSSRSASVDLLFDVTGYFAPGPGGSLFHAVPPGRVLDSRSGLAAGVFRAGEPQGFRVAGRASVATAAVAVTGNLTAVEATRAGYVALTPVSDVNPATSTLNLPAGDVRANGVTAPLGPDGRLWAVFRSGSGGRVHLLFDVTGYFAVGE